MEDGAVAEPAARRSAGAPVRDEPAAVGMREQHVVVLGQEPRRRGDVRVRAGRPGKIEQLPSVLVAERLEARPEPLHDLAHPGQPAPGRHVGDARRAEGGEVAEHHLVERRLRGERAAEPGRQGRHAHLRRAPPDPAWRNLDEGQPAAARVRERGGVVRREPLARARRAAAARSGAPRPGAARGLEDRPEVDTAQERRVVTVPGELGVEHRLHQRPQAAGSRRR